MPYRKISRLSPKRYLVHLIYSLGRRGSVLALLGVVWIMQGLFTYFSPERSDYWMLQQYPEVRLIGWLSTGAIAIAFAARPQGKDALGFLALYIMAAYRAASYTIPFVLWAFTSEDGNPRGIFGLLAWGTIILLIFIVSGWSEVHEPEIGGKHVS